MGGGKLFFSCCSSHGVLSDCFTQYPTTVDGRRFTFAGRSPSLVPGRLLQTHGPQVACVPWVGVLNLTFPWRRLFAVFLLRLRHLSFAFIFRSFAHLFKLEKVKTRQHPARQGVRTSSVRVWRDRAVRSRPGLLATLSRPKRDRRVRCLFLCAADGRPTAGRLLQSMAFLETPAGSHLAYALQLPVATIEALDPEKEKNAPFAKGRSELT